MKKVMSLLLVLMIVLSLSACGSNETATDNDTGNSTTQNQTDVTDTSSTEQSADTSSSTTDIIGSSDSTDIPNSTTTTKPNPPTHTHSYSGATCTAPAKCSCGATNGSALGHNWQDATCSSPKKCSRCGTTEGGALGHSYNASNYSKCWRCGVTKAGYNLEYSFGDTFIYEDSTAKFEITIGNSASVFAVKDWLHTEKYCPTGYAVKVPVTIKNVGSSTAHILEFWDYKLFTTDGAEVLNPTCFEYAYDDCLDSDDVRPNGSMSRYIYFNYTGDGNYVIEFNETASNQVTVVLNVNK